MCVRTGRPGRGRPFPETCPRSFTGTEETTGLERESQMDRGGRKMSCGGVRRRTAVENGRYWVDKLKTGAPESVSGMRATAGQHAQMLQESEQGFPSCRSSSGHPGTQPDSEVEGCPAPHAFSGALAKTGPAENWRSRRMATTMRICKVYPNFPVDTTVRHRSTPKEAACCWR